MARRTPRASMPESFSSPMEIRDAAREGCDVINVTDRTPRVASAFTNGVTDRFCRRGDGHDNPVVARAGRRRTTECGIRGTPRCQPIDLRAHDALEEFGRA